MKQHLNSYLGGHPPALLAGRKVLPSQLPSSVLRLFVFRLLVFLLLIFGACGVPRVEGVRQLQLVGEAVHEGGEGAEARTQALEGAGAAGGAERGDWKQIRKKICKNDFIYCGS